MKEKSLDDWLDDVHWHLGLSTDKDPALVAAVQALLKAVSIIAATERKQCQNDSK